MDMTQFQGPRSDAAHDDRAATGASLGNGAESGAAPTTPVVAARRERWDKHTVPPPDDDHDMERDSAQPQAAQAAGAAAHDNANFGLNLDSAGIC